MKKNRLFSLILLVTMFFSLYTQSEVAAVDSAATFDVVEFKYCDGNGTEITDFTNFTDGLDENTPVTITAKAKVKNNGTAEGDISLIFLAYQNGQLIKFKSDEKFSVSQNDTEPTSLEATITGLPAKLAGCTIYSYFWNDLASMEALTNPAEFGSDNAEIEYATVNGKKVTFDENGIGTVVLPASTSGNPAVEIFAKDVTTKLNGVNGILYGDGTITINTISTGGATKEYTVNYTKEPAKLTNVSYWDEHIDATYTVETEIGNRKLKLGTVKPNLVAADFYDEATGEYSKTINDVYGVGVYNGLENYVTPTASDRYPYWFYMDLPERFVGMNYIMPPYTNPGAVHSSNDKLTFTTNKSVRFYVSSNESWKDANGTHVGTYTFNQVRMGDSNATTTPYKDLKSTSTSQDHTFTNRMYYYDVIVPSGQESVTAMLKVQSAGTWDWPHIFYEFIEEDASAPFIDAWLEIESMKIKGIDVEFKGSEADVVFPYSMSGSISSLSLSDCVITNANNETNSSFNHDVDNKIITITNTYPNENATRTYTINYTVAPPGIIAKYSGASDYSGSNVWSERQVLKEASADITGAADDKKLSDVISLSLPGFSAATMPAQREEFKKIEQYANRLHGDTWSLFWDVPDALVGKTRVVYDHYNGTSWNNMNASTNSYYWTITIDADTRIWYSSRVYGNIAGLTGVSWASNSIHYLGADGVVGGDDDVPITPTQTTYGMDFKYINEGRQTTTSRTFAELKSGIRTLTEGSETNNIGYHYIYTADLTLPEGAESATYVIGGHAAGGATGNVADEAEAPAIFCYEIIEE